jgi:hypothetical protein
MYAMTPVAPGQSFRTATVNCFRVSDPAMLILVAALAPAIPAPRARNIATANVFFI